MAVPKTFDGAEARRIDKQYAAPALVEQRRRTLEALSLEPGEAVLDIGCGPGYLTLDMAERVGTSGRVVGVDTSQPMLDVAAARCAAHARIELRAADATALPYPDSSFDAVAAVQVYLFVPALDHALTELARVLKPGGRAVVVDTDWDSIVMHTRDAERTERYMRIWKQRYVDATVARRLPGGLRRAGLVIEHASAIPIVELQPDEASYSGSQLPEMTKFLSSKGGIALEEAQAWEADIRDLAARGEYFYALNRYLFVARTPG